MPKMTNKTVKTVRKYNGKNYQLVDGDHRKSLMEQRIASRRKKFGDKWNYRLQKDGDIWLIYGRKKKYT